MKHFVGKLEHQFECDAENEQDAQEILRLRVLTYMQIIEAPLVVLEEPQSSSEETASQQSSQREGSTGV